MQFKLRTLFILITACAMLIAASSLLPHPRSFWMGYDSKSQQAFDQIEAGQPKERALKLLGEPRATSPSFSREIAYCESDFKPAEIAQCCEFVVWSNGSNWFYCIGIDKNGIIVLKAQGNS
jgi:outer membrane protein assembly factor BamE (lipoprotein component of BamABCDE complex)